MPAHHGSRLQDDEGIAPAGPYARERDPEGAVGPAKRGARAATLKNGKLLAEARFSKARAPRVRSADLVAANTVSRSESTRRSTIFGHVCPAPETSGISRRSSFGEPQANGTVGEYGDGGVVLSLIDDGRHVLTNLHMRHAYRQSAPACSGLNSLPS
jgi:hypothetical protein